MNQAAIDPVDFAFAQAMEELQLAIDSVNSDSAKEQLEQLMEKIQEGETSSEDLRAELQRLSSASVDTGAITSEIYKIAEAAIIAQQALNNLVNTTAKTDRLGSPQPLGDLDFENRFLGEGGLGKKITSAFESEFGKPKKSRGGGGGKDNSDEIARNKEFLADLEREVEILQMAYGEREKARQQFETEKQVRSAIAQLSDTMGPKEIKQAEELIRLKAQLIEEEKKLKEIQKQNFEQAGEYGSVLGNLLGSAVNGTEDFEKALIKAGLALAQMAIQAQVLKTFGADSPTGNFVSKLIGGIFGGFRANGGPVSSNVPYVVGERGPEIFVPNSSGKVLSNSQSKSASQGGASGTVVVSLSEGLRAEIVSEANGGAIKIVQAGLQQYDKQLDKTLPSKYNKAQVGYG
jgi:hypothetical protein